MPLRAIIDNKEVISSFLTEEEWEELKNRIKKNSLDVIIYQTKKKGYLRKSKKGVKHFVHKKGELPESWEPESAQHLFVKNEVLLGCKDAGWQGIPEYRGKDWVADVLAVKGKYKVAFEVQWSYQTYDKTIERQNKYQRDKIRGCWLFKEAPKKYGVVESDLKELPLFNIFEDKNKKIKVHFYGKSLSVREFVKILLEGKIKFSHVLTSKRKQNITINFFDIKCYRCGYKQHSYYINPYIKSKCGLSFDASHITYKLRYHHQVIKNVQEFINKKGLDFRIGKIKKRYSKRFSSYYKSFGCYQCDVIFYDSYLRQDIRNQLLYDNHIGFVTEIELPSIIEKEEHWCCSYDKDFCFTNQK